MDLTTLLMIVSIFRHHSYKRFTSFTDLSFLKSVVSYVVKLYPLTHLDT